MVNTQRRGSKRRKKQGWSLGKILSIFIIAVTAGGLIYTTLRNFNGFGSIIEKKSESRYEGESSELMKVKTLESLSEKFIVYKGFNVSFNPHLHIPNYVVYELTRSEAKGDETRAKSFACDENVEGCAQPSDYTRSGYDRGHMAPAGDMKWNYDAMHESFFMTNVCPQKRALNGGGWKRLEEKVRAWVDRDSALIIITGPITEPDMPRIGGEVAVPPRFFKVVLAPYADPMRGIAFLYKHEGGLKDIEKQVVSIDSVERATGFDFFCALPDSIENKIEKESNYKTWNN